MSEDPVTSILVELEHGSGEIDVALSPQEVAIRSVAALQNATNAIKGMAKQVVTSINELPVSERPSTVEISFGLKLTSDANAFVVNAGVEAQIDVKLVWRNAPDDKTSESAGK